MKIAPHLEISERNKEGKRCIRGEKIGGQLSQMKEPISQGRRGEAPILHLHLIFKKDKKACCDISPWGV